MSFFNIYLSMTPQISVKNLFSAAFTALNYHMYLILLQIRKGCKQIDTSCHRDKGKGTKKEAARSVAASFSQGIIPP